MGVQSYLALYTLLLGWQEYDALWHMMASLGLLALPFAFIAYKAFKDPILSMGAKDAGIIGTRRFIFHILTALLILLFVGVPTVSLHPHLLHYKPTWSDAGTKIAYPGDTGTTYDDLLPIPDDIKVPIYWYVVLAISNGITDQAKDTISKPNVNLRALQSSLNLTTIQDPTLKAEVMRFDKECYLPAYRKYVKMNDSQEEQDSIREAQKKYGQDDVSWIGSEIFQTVSGFYNILYASSPVQGFPYNPSNPDDEIQGQVGHPVSGTPPCINWWQNENHGLRNRLYKQLDGKTQKDLQQLIPEGDENLAHDAIIRSLIEKSGGGGSFFNFGYSTEEDYRQGSADFLAKWGSKVFIDKAALEEYPKIHIIMNALPVIQAVLLFTVIMLLAIALPMFGYSFRFVITASVFLFSITFASFLWHCITWLDQFLLQALYGADAFSGRSTSPEMIRNMVTSAINPQKNLVDLTVSAFYVFVPFIWLFITSWGGIMMGNAFVGVKESEHGAEKVGRHAGQHGRAIPGKIGKILSASSKKGGGK